jgi:hypothetical protein
MSAPFSIFELSSNGSTPTNPGAYDGSDGAIADGLVVDSSGDIYATEATTTTLSTLGSPSLLGSDVTFTAT